MTDGITIGIFEGAFNSWLEGQRLTTVESPGLPTGTFASAADFPSDSAMGAEFPYPIRGTTEQSVNDRRIHFLVIVPGDATDEFIQEGCNNHRCGNRCW